MPIGLTHTELRELQLSVGTGRAARPLTPVEVADRYAVALEAGASRGECAKETQLRDHTMVDRFLKLRELPASITHLVDWGRSGKGAIGFSGAVELTHFRPETQEAVGVAIVEHELTKKEIVSIRQLNERSSDSLRRCIQRVLRRRPVVRHVEIVLGSVGPNDLQTALEEYSQRERNVILRAALEALVPDADITSARLGTTSFSVVGPRGVVARLDELGRPEVEIQQAIRRGMGLGNRPTSRTG